MSRTNLVRTLREPKELIAHGFAGNADLAMIEKVASRYAIAVTPDIAALIDPNDSADPIARQFIPTAAELEIKPGERADPIGDDAHSPVAGVVHRYPDRVLFKLVHVCAVYCRFCFRREMVGPGKESALSDEAYTAALDYIRAHHADITNLHLKDRKKNQGDNVPWGQGDTPITQVLQLLKKEKWPVRAYVEYEHRGTAGPVGEVKTCFDYVKRALA